ncbi:hypothetical protein HUG10_20505 (plasmid) [Halorarum halophilum]|uniref:Uncharacterized protein n=1 Tax=Halorarum halophilum TaxID=2743090 RepID=A0A7D5GKQ5_9EURY|nr:hypothetical protein [Halobaculum halophilum]QLG29991.1 hypothetical protein HUG10_20505 [Halobaculum halophilum]
MSTIDLFTDYIDYLESKEIAYAETYIPYYLCSVGCHMLNIRQQRLKKRGEKGIYAELGSYPNLRLNTMMVAPPGFSKTFFMELMLDPDIGIIGGTTIPTKMVQNMTEAAFVGSDGGGDEDDYDMGLAEKYKDGILGCEEFDSLAKVMQTDHSGNLDNMLLTALDSGRVRKDMAHANINYDTNVSLFAATQPMRMDLTSGFARRFMFLKFYPSPEQIDEMRASRRRGRGHDADFDQLQTFKNELGLKFSEKVAGIDQVRGVEKLDSIFDDVGVPHFEEKVYERMAMGYSVLKADSIVTEGGTTYLDIQPTRELRHLLRQAMEWRDSLMQDVEGDQILSVLRNTSQGSMEKEELKKFLQMYSMTHAEAEHILKRLRRNRMVEYNRDKNQTATVHLT